MTTGEIVPNEDASPNQWVQTQLPEYSNINEDHNSPDTLYNIWCNGHLNDNYISEFGFTTLNIGSDIISQIVVWTYVQVNNATYTPELAVSWNNGSNFSAYVEVAATTSWSWQSNTWSGLSYLQADLDVFQVSYRADVPIVLLNNYISCVYVVVTYAPPPYAHKFIGVRPADIRRVNRVLYANIYKIKGV